MKHTFFRLRSYQTVAILCVGAIMLWGYSAKPLADAGDPPDENRFTKVVLAEKLNKALEMAILPDERVLLVEQHGDVRLYSPPREITKGNKNFYLPGQPIAYQVKVTDKEDGSLASSGATLGRIWPNR